MRHMGGRNAMMSIDPRPRTVRLLRSAIGKVWCGFPVNRATVNLIAEE
jgi:hypothetical protein